MVVAPMPVVGVPLLVVRKCSRCQEPQRQALAAGSRPKALAGPLVVVVVLPLAAAPAEELLRAAKQRRQVVVVLLLGSKAMEEALAA